MTGTTEASTFRAVLAQPVFRVVFYVRSLAIAADTLRILAMSVLVFQATGSTALAAATFGAGFLPQVLGGVLLGTLPDVVRPRPLIATGYLIECAGAAALAVIGMPVAASLLIVAALGCLAPVFHGTAGRLTADVLAGDAYVLGRGLLNMAASLAQLAGLAAGGIAVAAIGAKQALLICAAAHLVAAVCTRLLLPNLPAARGAGASPRGGLRGTRRLLADRALRRLLLTQWLPPACATGAMSLLVPYADLREFPSGAVGPMMACVPVGMLAGDVVVARLVAPALRERLVAPLIALLGLPLLGFALDIGPALAAVLLFVAGLGYTFGLGLQRRFIDLVPDGSRGQALALLSTGLMTLQGIGPILIGGLTEVIPAGSAMAVAGAATLAIAGWHGVRGYRD